MFVAKKIEKNIKKRATDIKIKDVKEQFPFIELSPPYYKIAYGNSSSHKHGTICEIEINNKKEVCFFFIENNEIKRISIDETKNGKYYKSGSRNFFTFKELKDFKQSQNKSRKAIDQIRIQENKHLTEIKEILHKPCSNLTAYTIKKINIAQEPPKYQFKTSVKKEIVNSDLPELEKI